MRSDQTQSRETFRRSDQWNTDPFTNQREPQIDRRYELGRVESETGTQWHSFSGHERNCFFHNQQGRKFLDESTLSGLDQIADSRSFALWDFDRDGATDIALTNADYPLVNLYRNQTKAPNHFIAIRLTGGNTSDQASRELSSRDAYGALVRIEAGDLKLLREHRCGEGFAAQNSATMLIGLGDEVTIDQLTIRWPSGRSSTWNNLPADNLLQLFETAAVSPTGETLLSSNYLPAKPAWTDSDQEPIHLDRSGTRVTFQPIDMDALLPKDLPRDRRLYLLTSMATWCDACYRHQPHLKRLAVRFADSLVLCGIPVDPIETPDELRRYANATQAAYHVLSDMEPGQRDQIISIIRRQLDTESIPCSILVDRAGQILQVFYGTPTASDIGRYLE